MKSFNLVAATAIIILMSLAGTTGARAETADSAAHAPEAVQAQFQQLVKAVQADDLKAFVANGDDDFKAMTQDGLDALSKQLAPRLKAGYHALYFTSLNKQGYLVYFWKMSFDDGSDDLLATVSVKGGKVGGFYLV